MGCLNDFCVPCVSGGAGACAAEIADRLGVTQQMTWGRWTASRRSALHRGLSFALPFERFAELAWSACFYCGAPPSNVTKFRHGSLTYQFPYQGIDRVNNAHGYEPSNVVPCCFDCNRAKGTKSRAEFLNHARRVAAGSP